LDESNPFQYTIVCCSYRGYWTSSGRPSETGIAQDAAASLEWVKNQEANELQEDGPQTQPTPVILWGQSIGCGVATSLAARQELFSEGIELRTLILETPFLSIRSMLETIYPQKWLPYQYLWPFLRNHFDSVQALTNVEENSRRFGHKAPNVLILEAGKDELVPAVHGKILGSHCLELGLKFRKVVVPSAYHTEVMTRGPEGRVAVVESVLKAVKAKSL
jgi:acetyl esterase/lipase